MCKEWGIFEKMYNLRRGNILEVMFFYSHYYCNRKKKNHTRFCLSVQRNPFKTELLAHLRHAVPFTR